MLYKMLKGCLGFAFLVRSISAQADIPEVVFDCSVTPNACANMCWGAYCSGYEVSLNFDNPSQPTKDARRKKATCLPNPNRCSGGNPNNSCDEYPFASTSNADDVQQVSRCVPAGDNNSASIPLHSPPLVDCDEHSSIHSAPLLPLLAD